MNRELLSLSLSCLIGMISVPAHAGHKTRLSIPASICRWDPTDDPAVWTGSQFNQYWIASYYGNATVEVYCPVPAYVGLDSEGDLWGTSAVYLEPGELRVHFQSTAVTHARVIGYSSSSGVYSMCAFASGSGLPGVLAPEPCNPHATVMSIQVNVPHGGKLLGVMVHDEN